ncbi:MAG: ROK family protein [Chloroflexi bacterium]|nr:ROK family protein [Chloroflexota bacterium]
MIQVAILTRRLKEGKTYEDFRKAWFHTTGFGLAGGNKMYTMINAFDPREIIVIGITEVTLKQFSDTLNIDVDFRLEHSLDDIIEPEIGRKFGLLVSEDDFSAAGDIAYKPPCVSGKETNIEEFYHDLKEAAEMIARASEKRDKAKKAEI